MIKPPFDWGPLLEGGPLFIGILNLTPDSFSDGGRFLAPEAALAQARVLVAAGAGMLDLGAESTRPGATPVPPAKEWERLEPVLAALGEQLPTILLSLDTRHAEVAARGLSAGVAVLNDVTGFSDPGMLELARGSACGLIAMRSRPEGAGFHMPPYDDPAPRDAEEAIQELRAVCDRLRRAGISSGRLLLDPGFGFGTTFQEDLALWEALPGLPGVLAWPAQRFCLGLSRKRFLAARAGAPSLPPDQRDGLTAGAHAEARQWDYRVFRTHAIG
ncbi:MAG: dihydropteroate synthase [Holophagaceae bacterium]|nr:dihydropteroate synthase [Holophagaceae bacterium]